MLCALNALPAAVSLVLLILIASVALLATFVMSILVMLLEGLEVNSFSNFHVNVLLLLLSSESEVYIIQRGLLKLVREGHLEDNE